MKRIASWTAAVLALGTATTAQAADLDGPSRYSSGAAYRPFSWTGLYVGVHGGLGWTDADWNFSNASLSHSGYGGLLGAQVGYNFQIGRAVLGLEGDYSGSWMGGTDACPNPAFNCSHDVNWLGSMRGRFGYTFNDNRTMVYGTAGLAWVDGTARTQTVGGANFGSGLDFSQRGDPKAVLRSSWAADEHTLGSYSFTATTTDMQQFDDLAAPAGRVHFAGEHTHRDYFSTVHGAYLSGQRVAKEILDAS
mgnify:CR=1 FL=1